MTRRYVCLWWKCRGRLWLKNKATIHRKPKTPPEKLEETRQKGQVPLSREMNNWVMLLAGTIVVVAMGGAMMTSLAETMRAIFANSYQ